MLAACKRFYARTSGALLPLGGFVAGWSAYRLAEDKGVIGEENIQRIRLANLKLQLFLQQRILPSSIAEKYGYPEEFLKSAIERLSESDAQDERWTFDMVLKECDVPEQLAWLEEHISFDIPYFYIADLFNGWCNVHQELFYRDGGDRPTASAENDAFASEVMCRGVVDKMLSGVFPYDVAVRALCILAVGHRRNAQLLPTLLSPDAVLERYQTYRTEAAEQTAEAADVVPADVVAAATLELLRAMNAAAVHRRAVPFWGRPSTGPYPIASQLDGPKWCECFTDLPASLSKKCSDQSVLLADILSERFACVAIKRNQ